MSEPFACRYPNINRFVFERRWIEIGSDEYSDSFLRALDPGGLIWDGKPFYPSLDDALDDLEQGLPQWLKQNEGEDAE